MGWVISTFFIIKHVRGFSRCCNLETSLIAWQRSLSLPWINQSALSFLSLRANQTGNAKWLLFFSFCMLLDRFLDWIMTWWWKKMSLFKYNLRQSYLHPHMYTLRCTWKQTLGHVHMQRKLAAQTLACIKRHLKTLFSLKKRGIEFIKRWYISYRHIIFKTDHVLGQVKYS